MAFEIVNETYLCSQGENPKKYGYIEGYTSNTVGETFLRLNCKRLIEEDQVDWYRCVYGEVPTVPNEYQRGCHELRAGDVVGEGICLNKKQVRQLVKKLKQWLRRGK